MNLEKSDWLGDWYVLRGDHTDIEGTAKEWREILFGMTLKKPVHHTRVALIFSTTGMAELRSPRNCMGRDDCAIIPEYKIEKFIAESLAVIVIGEGEHENGDGI